MFKFLILRPKWMVVAVGVLAFWLTQKDWLTASHLWQKAEGTLIDRRYLLRGEDLPDPNVKLVGLGTSSFKLDTLAPEEIAASPTLQLMQHPWPWDRRVYAAILEKLMGAGAKVVMISGYSLPSTEFNTPYRIINWHTCNGCWSDPQLRFNHTDFLWCPRHAGTPRQFECTRLITSTHVMRVIEKIPGFGKHRSSANKSAIRIVLSNDQ